MKITILVLRSFFGCQANILFVYLPCVLKLCSASRSTESLYGKKDAFQLIHLILEIYLRKSMISLIHLKKEFGFTVLCWKLDSIA